MGKRRCRCCREYGHFKPKCPNKERIRIKKEHTKQKNLAEKERKKLSIQYIKCVKKVVKIAKKNQANLQKNIDGDSRQTIKGRAGSSRNGFVRTYTANHVSQFNFEELIERNKLLGVNKKKCFWCKTNDATDLDHYIPMCCPKYDIYGMPHQLNMFPSCSNCNSKLKGGKQPEEWNEILRKTFCWKDDDISKLNTWRKTKYVKLVLPTSHHSYLKRQFNSINSFHKLASICAIKGLEISNFITIDNLILEQM